MIWMVDDDGSASFRFRVDSLHGPAVMIVVDKILQDLRLQGIDVSTNGSFSRYRRHVGTEMVWTGRIMNTDKVPDARDYFNSVAELFHGRRQTLEQDGRPDAGET